MPKGKPGSGDKHQPQRFLVQRGPGVGKVWGVKQGDRWRWCEDLTIQVTVASVVVFDGSRPTWCLSGVGVVRCLQRGAIVITA